MYYLIIDLAVNDPESEQEFKMWTEIFPKLGNQEAALERGYFWVIREAKLIEGSAVIAGSNSLTPTETRTSLLSEIEKNLGEIKTFDELCSALKNFEPGKTTQNNKPRGSKYLNIKKIKHLQK